MTHLLQLIRTEEVCKFASCLLWLMSILLRVDWAQTWDRFLVHHSNKRKTYVFRLSRCCHRPEFGGSDSWATKRIQKRWTEAICRCSRGVMDPFATWKPWLGVTSLPGGRLERNHLLKVSLWCNNYVYLCCPSVVSLSVQMCHSHSFVIPGYIYML